MKKTRKNTKLNLGKEAVRMLSAPDLEGVAGGGCDMGNPCTCTSCRSIISNVKAL